MALPQLPNTVTLVIPEKDRQIVAETINDALAHQPKMQHVFIEQKALETLCGIYPDVRRGSVTLDAPDFVHLFALIENYAADIQNAAAPRDERDRVRLTREHLFDTLRDAPIHQAPAPQKPFRIIPRSTEIDFVGADENILYVLRIMCETPRLLDAAHLSHRDTETALRLVLRLRFQFRQYGVKDKPFTYVVTKNERALLYRMLTVCRTFALEPNTRITPQLKTFSNEINACFKNWHRVIRGKTDKQSVHTTQED